MERLLAGFTAISILSTCAGCAAGTEKKPAALPDNEVISMIPYDTNKQVVTIATCDNLDVAHLQNVLSQKFPQYSFVMRFGCDSDLKIKNHFGDIYLLGDSSLEPSTEEHLLDLSTLNSTTHYFTTALQSCVSHFDGAQYLLPTPALITGIIYNKTMFEENGWQVPKSRTEFIKLCQTIDESGVVERAFQPSLTFTGAVMRFAQMFNQSHLFDTVEYTNWMNTYAESSTDTIEPILRQMYGVFEDFLNEGIIEVGDFMVKPPERSNMMYGDRTAAMTIETQFAERYAEEWGSKDTFSMFPFYSGDEPGDDYVVAATSIHICVDKDVAADQEKLKAVTDILDFIATDEGQKAFVEDGPLISWLKDSQMDLSGTVMLADVEDTIKAGRMCALQPLYSKSQVWSNQAFDYAMNGLLHTDRMGTEITAEDRAVTFDEAVAYMDSVNLKVRNMEQSQPDVVYATAEREFTQLETTQYMAQMFQDKTGADIALCLNNTKVRGNMGAFYEGQLASTPTAAEPISIINMIDWSKRGAVIDENDQKLVVLSMTGQQVLDALENPDKVNFSEFTEPFFVGAGLKIKFAPWAKKGSRYLDVSLADGSKLEPDKLYTVAAWSHTVDSQYVTEQLKIYDDTLADMLVAQLERDKEIAPFTDGRFTLDWSVQ